MTRDLKSIKCNIRASTFNFICKIGKSPMTGTTCVYSHNQRQRKSHTRKDQKKDNQERLAKEELDSRDKHHKTSSGLFNTQRLFLVIMQIVICNAIKLVRYFIHTYLRSLSIWQYFSTL